MSNSERVVVLRLYKSLLKLGRSFDRHPVAKLLIYKAKEVAEPSKNPSLQYYTSLMSRVLKKRNMLNPSDNVSLEKLIQKEFRSDRKVNVSCREDVAFFAIKKLSGILNYYHDFASSHENYHPFKLDAGDAVDWAPAASHKLLPTFTPWTKPLQPGVILMSHPMMPGQMGRSLVLLLEHSASGSYGLVINKPLGIALKDAVMNLPEDIMQSFSSSCISFGGLVRRLQYLHSDRTVGGVEVPGSVYPMFAGGRIADAMASVEKNRQSTLNYSFYAGCSTWFGDRLERDVEKGYWIPLASQPDLVVSLANFSMSDAEIASKASIPFTVGSVRSNPSDKAALDGSIERLEEELEAIDEEEEKEHQRDAKKHAKELKKEQADELYSMTIDEIETKFGKESAKMKEVRGIIKKAAEDGIARLGRKTGRERRRAKREMEIEKLQAAVVASMEAEDMVARHLTTLPAASKKDAEALTEARIALSCKADHNASLNGVDVYDYAARSLGGHFRAIVDFPDSVNSDCVEPSDWR